MIKRKLSTKSLFGLDILFLLYIIFIFYFIYIKKFDFAALTNIIIIPVLVWNFSIIKKLYDHGENKSK